ncbi:MAG TPA: NADH-quinone oxidoreductase subunit J [Candidatus Synoicihabitans sp.]|nr:NADH-quinone oxidoreductase subunit J [Candidatus Synoicihabitans sp.]
MNVLFHVFAFFTLLCAIMTVINRNAVNSAMFFLLSLTGVAALFVLLDAFLLAVVLVLVYAGAVVALFLFIIMLLDMGGNRRPFSTPTIVAGALAGALLVVGLLSFSRGAYALETADAAAIVPVGASLRGYAAQLFTTYLLPVQITGFLLLVAMLGVIVLSKKFPQGEGAK